MAETLASGLRKRLWILIVGAVFGIVAGWATANASSLDEVTSSAQILITGELSEGKVDTALASTQYVGQRMPTYAGLATSEIVKGEVAKRLNVDVSTLSPADIIVGNPTGTTLLDIAVKSKKPADAKARAEAIVDVLSAQIKGIENPPGAPARVSLATVSKPNLPPPPAAPPLLTASAMGAVGGFLLGGTVAASMAIRARNAAERRRLYEASFASAEGLAPEPAERDRYAPRSNGAPSPYRQQSSARPPERRSAPPRPSPAAADPTTQIPRR